MPSRETLTDLPVLTPSVRTPLACGERDFRAVAANNFRSFIRPISISPELVSVRGLRATLEEVDATFMAIAALSGSVVVGHDWGVLKYSSDLEAKLELTKKVSILDECNEVVPKGFSLAARVQVAKDTRGRRLTRSEKKTIRDSLDTHNRNAGYGELLWIDGGEHQFRPGGRSRGLSRKVWLVDIEPAMIRRTQALPPYLGL